MDIIFNRPMLQISAYIQTSEISVFVQVGERVSVQKKCKNVKMRNCVLTRKYDPNTPLFPRPPLFVTVSV